LRYHQTRLDQFLNSQKTFRGVFYLPPGKRTVKLSKDASARKEAWNDNWTDDVLEKIKKETEKEDELKRDKEDFDELVSALSQPTPPPYVFGEKELNLFFVGSR